jgi:shikimate kinase
VSPAGAAHIVLVGLPGVGKTTTGRELAAALGLDFVDLDELVVGRTGKTIAQIFAAGGEPAFRAAEREATAEIAGWPRPVVLAAGGGWTTDPATVALLRPPARLIYLRTSAERLAERLDPSDRSRPMLADNPMALLPRLYMERRQGYESADWAVDVENLDPQQLTKTILRLVGG